MRSLHKWPFTWVAYGDGTQFCHAGDAYSSMSCIKSCSSLPYISPCCPGISGDLNSHSIKNAFFPPSWCCVCTETIANILESLPPALPSTALRLRVLWQAVVPDDPCLGQWYDTLFNYIDSMYNLHSTVSAL